MSEAKTIAVDLQRLLTEPAALTALFKQMRVTLEHPVLRLPEAAQVVGLLQLAGGGEQLKEFLMKRERLIDLMKSDPLRHGWKPQMWKDAKAELQSFMELLLLGGNRSTKTEFAADYSVNDLVLKPDREWGFFHSSQDSSIRLQQSRIYRYLPPEWRDIGKQGKNINVSFKEVSGFHDGKIFILPNGSRGYFFNYMQDPKVLEGYELDGAWLDELAPLEWIEAVRYRLVTRRGKLILTFTPVTGYTVTVGKYLAGASIVRSLPSPLLPVNASRPKDSNVPDCPPGEMPYIMQCVNRSSRVMFFFTEFNKFNPYDELVKKLEGAPVKEVKMRAYGWPEKAVGNAFAKFGAVHIVKRCASARPPLGIMPPHPWVTSVTANGGTEATLYDKLPKLGTNYCFCDPGNTKNWVIKWYRVQPEPEWTFIYREWPDMQTHGAWAEPGNKPDGKNGPAQRSDFGGGILKYKKLILEAEGWVWTGREWDGTHAEEILEREMDSRMGGMEVPTEEEGTSLIQMMAEEQTDRAGNVIGPSMFWKPACGHIPDPIQTVNDFLDYNQDEPVSVYNAPRLYVCEDCEQSIYAFREYTGLDGLKGALKDIVDPDVYYCKRNPGYVPPGALEVTGGMG